MFSFMRNRSKKRTDIIHEVFSFLISIHNEALGDLNLAVAKLKQACLPS